MNWLQKLTSRKFINTVGASFTAIIACYAAWQTPGIPVERKVDLTLAAIAAITAVVSFYTHTEGAIDKTQIATEANSVAAAIAAQSTPIHEAEFLPMEPGSLDLLSGVALDDNGEEIIAPGGTE